MGTTGKWVCLDCGNEFTARCGGGFCFSLYRCVKCDRTKEITTKQYQGGKSTLPNPKEIGKCGWCGGELRTDIGPMCWKCKSRNTKETEITMFYD